MIKAFSLPGLEQVDDESELEEDTDDESEIEDKPDETQTEFYNDLSNICEHIPCFAHTLKLVIKDGFKEAASINKVLSKVSTIVSHVKKSTIATDILEGEK